MLSVVSLQLTFNTISRSHLCNSLPQFEIVIRRDSHLICLEEGLEDWHWRKKKSGKVSRCLLPMHVKAELAVSRA